MPPPSGWFWKPKADGRLRHKLWKPFKVHSRSSSPNPPSSALPQAPLPGSVLPPAPSPNQSSSVLPQEGLLGASRVPSSGGSNDLWNKAYDKLPNEFKQHLGVNIPDANQAKLETLQDVLKLAKEAKEAKMANGRKLKWGDKEIDVEGTVDRLVGWITKFKEIGDIAVQYDPVHAALPWAGVRSILLVRSTIRFLYMYNCSDRY